MNDDRKEEGSSRFLWNIGILNCFDLVWCPEDSTPNADCHEYLNLPQCPNMIWELMVDIWDVLMYSIVFHALYINQCKLTCHITDIQIIISFKTFKKLIYFLNLLNGSLLEQECVKLCVGSKLCHSLYSQSGICIVFCVAYCTQDIGHFYLVSKYLGLLWWLPSTHSL
jgi:hypothetical protein